MKTQLKRNQYSLKHDEVQALCLAPSGIRDQMIIKILYYWALRRAEARDLMIENINFENGRAIITGKGQKIGVIPVGSLYPDFLTQLKIYLAERRTGPVFMSNRGGKMSLHNINRIVRDAGLKAKLKNPDGVHKYINPHLLRHSQARHLKNQRYPVEFIQNYLRHSSIKTTMDTYGKLGLEDMEQIAMNQGVQIQ